MNHQPQVVKYFDEIMPIIIHTCANCCVELFRSMTFERTNDFKSLCLTCLEKLEEAAWKYEELGS